MRNIFFKENKIEYKKLFFILTKLNLIKHIYSDIYLQINKREILNYFNGKIENIINSSFNGMSVKVIKNYTTCLISLNEIDCNYFIKNLYIFNKIFENKKLKKKLYFNNIYLKKKYFKNNFFLKHMKKKMYLFNKIYKLIKSKNKNISNIKISLDTNNDKICIINNNGIFFDDRKKIILKIFLVVEKNKKYSYGCSSVINSKIENFYNKIKNKDITYVEKCVYDSIKIANMNIYAKDAPYGEMEVILSSGCPGILLHEAIGHGLEGDFIRNKTSIFYNKINKKIASNICTIVDDGTLKNSNGYINIDDEGVPGKYNILIENGILKNIMLDKYNAHLMKTNSTGNGRRESYDKNVIPRMTNTYLLPKQYKKDEIIKSVKYGIYAKFFTDGQVDITSGKFVFSTLLAFLIKNGKVLYPIKKVSLIGFNLNIMNNISMVGNDLEIYLGSSICIKNNQSIPVSIGQPTIKIDKITVGGTK